LFVVFIAKVTMAHNIQMPLFASVGMGANSGAYSEGDNFDVDMLAEYLLEDGAFSPGGVTFDFNLDSKMQQETLSTVSPENSEDGYMPPVAESSNMFFSVPDPTPLPPPPICRWGADAADAANGAAIHERPPGSGASST
jgi:hypothetical protein